MQMADGETEEGTGVSEGELEDGEVLSSEEEEEEEGEVKEPEGKGEGDNSTAETSDGGRTATKRPAPDHAHAAASPKSPKLDSAAPAHTDSMSDLEEGEIFSDDEESAYYPQLVKSRSTTKPDKGRESDSSESEAGGERKRRSHGRSFQGSPERDSYQSRWRRSTERERDSDGSGLFFEDRDGGRSDDSRDKKGDQSYHSSSKQDHGYSSSTSSKYSRERDRDRGDRDRRDKSDSYHRRDKDSHRSRDHDSNVDSSEEESSSSSWSQRHHRTSRPYHSYQKGRRGQSYQQKYGQKYDKFGGMGGAGGRQSGEREGSQSGNWAPAPGRMNTGMTAQQFNALAEKVRKRREKGLPLLPTPKVKPSDNLDQFNYPAPPSWYLEAIENWEKEQKEKAENAKKGGQKEGSEESVESVAKVFESDEIEKAEAIRVAASDQSSPPPPPLFPVQSQPINSAVGTELPSIPAVAAVIGTNLPGAPEVPTPSGGVGVSGEGGGEGGGGGGGGEWLGVGEVRREGVGGGEMTTSLHPLKTVEVSSLALNMEGVDEEDELEGVGMKIALETPTPQPDVAKKFDVFQAAPEKEAKDGDTPAIENANDGSGKEEGKVEMMETEEQGDSMDKGEVGQSGVPLPSRPSLPPPIKPHDQTSETSSQPTPLVAPSNTPPPATVTLATTAPSTPTLPLMSVQAPGGTGEEMESSHLESENEEDFDYDEYLDQLIEEEEEVQPLTGSLSSELLQSNPLDEDFPTINPTNEASKHGEGGGVQSGSSLKALLRKDIESDEDEEKDTDNKAKGVKRKSVRRKQKQAEWWARHNREKEEAKTVKPPCKYYLNGFCKHGDSCQYNHDIPRPKKKEVCKFYLQDHCNKGEDCLFYHGTFPCKFFHTKTYCKHGNSCKFSHDPLTDETTELLAQVLEPTKDPLKQIELSAMGIPETTPLALPLAPPIAPPIAPPFAPPIPAPIAPPLAPPIAPPIAPPTSDQFYIPATQPQGGLQLQQGSDSQVRVKFFLPDNQSNLSQPSGNFIPPPNPIRLPSSTDSDKSSLVVSIPNQLLDRSLVISIPRQKLGPPFGTVPISNPTLPPTSTPAQPPSVPPSLPPSFVSAPQSSPSMNFVPPGQPHPRPFPTLPNQSAPITNFSVPPRTFLRPPGPNQLQVQSIPPQPNGWQSPAQPTPLFPPAMGTQEILPVPPNAGPVPPAHPPSHPHPTPGPQPPSQNHLPQSERKGLLPTPPSHMQLNPENINWTEGEAPEYWEAPGVSGPGGGRGRGRGKTYSHHSQPLPRYAPQGQVDSNKHPPPVPPQFGSGPGHPQPPGPMFGGPRGPFGPPHPPPHTPQQAVGGQGPSFDPRNQPVASGMDPRQARLEPGLGGAIDPRRGIPPTNVVPVQPRPPMADPRHQAGTIPPPSARMPTHPPGPQPPGLAYPLQPQPPPTFAPPGPRQWAPPQPSLHPPVPQQPGMSPPHPGHTPFQPTSSIPIPPPTGTTTGVVGEIFAPVPPTNVPHIPPGQVPGIGHFGTGMSPPPPNQPPVGSIHPPQSDMGMRPVPWGGNAGMSPEYSTSSSTTSSPVTRLQRDGDQPPASDTRPLRVDPRTKYSHLRIKTKGSAGSNPPQGSPVGGHSILKRGAQGEGGSGEQSAMEKEGSAKITFSPMPKLLQNRDNLEKPLDPKELFGSAGAQEASSEFEMTGPFGSSIGSYFTRMSESHLSKQPFGEITMPEIKEKEEEGDTGKKEDEVAAEVDTKEKEEVGKEGEEANVEVPSYMAELGLELGESDLMIDSAFSSLDKKGGEMENETQKQKSQDAAKKLPSIFGFTL